jgi:hypothetical protein
VSRSNRYFSPEPHLIRRWMGLMWLVLPAEGRVIHVPRTRVGQLVRRLPGAEVFDIRGNLLGRIEPVDGSRADADGEDV